MRNSIISIAAFACLLIAPRAGAEISGDVIRDAFYPYENWTPTAEGYEPGVVITADNVEQYRDIVDEFLYRYVSKGWYEIKTGPTFGMPLHPNYVQATRENAEGVSLSPEGTLVGYSVGRPFPQEPDVNDPEAGLKLIWNFQRGFNAGDSETIRPFWWTFRNANNGKTERQLRFHWRFLNWKHRTVFDPKPDIEPNPGQIFRSIYSTVLEPFDLGNTQLLIQRYEDDLRRDDGWLYLSFQRRVRRLAVGQITDAFLGTDAMIEDFEGYNGRISDYNWKYVGTRNMLTPFVRHLEQDLADEPADDPDGFRFIDMGGKGNCFPMVTWQLRKVYEIEGTPKDENHPLSRRVLFADAETMTFPVVHVYDRKGDPWKWFPICKSHSDHHLPGNKGAGVAVDDCAVFFDEQAMHCTTLQFKSYINKEDNAPNLFNVQNLRKRGR